MKQVIVNYVTPETNVQLSNITVDVKKKTFQLTLGQKTSRQRKFHTETVEGTITGEVYQWLTKFRAVKVPVEVKENDETVIKWIPTGAQATSFQKYLTKRGIEFKPGVLTNLVFEGENTSKDYAENPFRLVMLKDRNILSLVNVPSKKKQEYVDPSTGEVRTFYSVKKGQIDGRTVKAFVRPDKYRRLVVQTTKEVEVANLEQQQA